jgi:3-oxoacyl-[acyl-carrier-protein] synthase III
VVRSATHGSRLLAFGAARPDVVVTSAELGAPFGRTGDWVEVRTGIRELRRLDHGETIVDLAIRAGRIALERAGVDIDLVITASCSTVPGIDQGGAIARGLVPHAATFQINAACSGFSYALATADALIRADQVHHVLIVAAEHMSRLIDPADLGTSIIFGDGAGAAVVGPAREPGVGPVVWGSDGSRHEVIACDLNEVGVMRMQGQHVFRWAVETFPGVALEACKRAGVRPDDIAVFVPHQANLRIIEAVTRRLGLSRAAVASDIVRTGNTSAASIPLALDAMIDEGRAPAGRLALLVGFGAGLAHAAQVVALPACA